MGRKTTSFLGAVINSITGTGTTITRKKDFWGKSKTVVKNYDTGKTKEYTHGTGFLGNTTKVKVKKNDIVIQEGKIKKNFFGSSTETLRNTTGNGIYTEKRMNAGFFGNKDSITIYDHNGKIIGSGNGRSGLIFNSYTNTYEGQCFRCNGTGIFEKTGMPCRKCNGSGIYRKIIRK